ncbi:hypothetical protein EDB80DRAFT_875532 [Ilyonectria destructans]|nr:hypothetical protein EDB80DRAFT_875532 [Ilyonectria destructans]
MAAPRILVVSGELSGVGHETFGSNELMHRSINPPLRVALTDEDVPQTFAQFSEGWGGECRLEITMTAKLVTNRHILVTVNGKFFEGDSETTTDLEDDRTQTVLVPRGAIPIPFVMQLYNPGASDTGTIRLTFTNTPRDE